MKMKSVLGAAMLVIGHSLFAATTPPAYEIFVSEYTSQVDANFSYKDGYSGTAYPRDFNVGRHYESDDNVSWYRMKHDHVTQQPVYHQINDWYYEANGNPFSGTVDQMITYTLTGVVTHEVTPIQTIDVNPSMVQGSLYRYVEPAGQVYRITTNITDTSWTVLKYSGGTAGKIFRYRLYFTVEEMAFGIVGNIVPVGYVPAQQITIGQFAPINAGGGQCYIDIDLFGGQSTPQYISITPFAEVGYYRYYFGAMVLQSVR